MDGRGFIGYLFPVGFFGNKEKVDATLICRTQEKVILMDRGDQFPVHDQQTAAFNIFEKAKRELLDLAGDPSVQHQKVESEKRFGYAAVAFPIEGDTAIPIDPQGLFQSKRAG